jgi:hypothetical protein
MLELNYPAALSLDIRNVLDAVLGVVDNLLPLVGKLSFPRAVPFRFVLTPRVAKTRSQVSPMPNPDFSALCNHRTAAARTLAAGQIGLSFLALLIDDSKFHISVGDLP